MSVEITKVQNRAELKKFIRFNYELYKDNPYSVPDLLEDMLDTYNPKKNPAFEFCEADYYLAWRDGKIVGRVACIINHKANRTWNEKTARFGWIDFIDDLEVSGALLRQAEDWAQAHQCDRLVGPLGFTDLDAEGMLIDGFDQLSTMSTIYNYPYYPQHLEHYGYTHDVDWVERKIFVPENGHEADQAKYFRVAEIVKQRLNLRVRKFKSVKEIRKDGYLYQGLRTPLRIQRDQSRTGRQICQPIPAVPRSAPAHRHRKRRRRTGGHGRGHRLALARAPKGQG